MTRLFLYFFLCAASHGVLDAMTNGGLGVAFSPLFDTTRYFFPVRPVLVSLIEIGEFFSEYGVRGAWHSPAALVSQIRGISVAAIMRSRSSYLRCRLAPISRTATGSRPS